MSNNYLLPLIFKIILMLQLCQKIGFGFASSQRYIIKKSSYLVAAPPKQPLNAYKLFFTDITTNMKGISVSERAKKVSEEWKNISKEKKAEYEKNAS